MARHVAGRQEIVILGGGAAGWIAASPLAKKTNRKQTRITLVESEEIGIIGVGEATVPILAQCSRVVVQATAFPDGEIVAFHGFPQEEGGHGSGTDAAARGVSRGVLRASQWDVVVRESLGALHKI